MCELPPTERALPSSVHERWGVDQIGDITMENKSSDIDTSSSGTNRPRMAAALYEYTPHNLTAPDPKDAPPPRAGDMRRVDILPDAFFLTNVLSAEECDAYIAAAEQCGMIDSEYNPDIRKTDRVAVHGVAVAALLFDRVQSHLEDVHTAPSSPPPPPSMLAKKEETSEADGPSAVRWVPSHLNPTFRICRYTPGGHFRPHRDGGFRESDVVASKMTFMLYLNEGFRGGETRFFDHRQQLYAEPEEANIIYRYRPQKGSVLIFDSHLPHDGSPLLPWEGTQEADGGSGGSGGGRGNCVDGGGVEVPEGVRTVEAAAGGGCVSDGGGVEVPVEGGAGGGGGGSGGGSGSGSGCDGGVDAGESEPVEVKFIMRSEVMFEYVVDDTLAGGSHQGCAAAAGTTTGS